jgi:hypothetical protein
MKITPLAKFLYSCALILSLLSAQAGEPAVIHVDLATTIKSDLRPGVASANICWLTDSDLKIERPISMQTALRGIGCGSLRFPYGHLANNYLWHTGDLSDTANGLRPKVAAPTRTPKWEWAVNEDASFKAAMDFDEYIDLCKALQVKPLVVVNVLSHKYKNGPSYDLLKQTAVEWVRYAKTKDYPVEYWQIGNEMNHHSNQLSKKEYEALYIDFVSSMKAVDPTIKTGPGLINAAYLSELYTSHPHLFDFISAHLYMYGVNEHSGNYELWKESTSAYSQSLGRAHSDLLEGTEGREDWEFLITETGVTPANDILGRRNNVWKGLWWFELLMNELSIPSVSYVYYWGTHTPWLGSPTDGKEPKDDVGVLLSEDNTRLTPTGQSTRLVNKYLLDKLVKTTRANQYIRAYATASNHDDALNIFLLNKNDQEQELVIQLDNNDHHKEFEQNLLSGKGWADADLVKSKIPQTVSASEENTIRLTVPPLSILVLSSSPSFDSTTQHVWEPTFEGTNRNAAVADANWSDRLEYVGIAVEEPGFHVWGSSPVIGPEGRVHLFVARWPVSSTFNGWKTNSEIARYVGDSPEGPFTFQEVVLTGTRTGSWDSRSPHNPTIQKVGDQYALFYIANTGSDFPASQRIGLAVSESLEGPWRKAGKDGLILSPPKDAAIWSHESRVGVNNPALLQHPDGRFFLYYKAMIKRDVRRMGVAIADQLEGPYLFHDRPLTSNQGTIEDGFAFMENDTVHLLTTDNKNAAGLLWTSHNGLTFGEPTLGFGRMDHYISKKVVEEATNYRGRKFERPQVLLRDGRPTHLYLAAGANINQGDGSCSYVFRINQPPCVFD